MKRKINLVTVFFLIICLTLTACGNNEEKSTKAPDATAEERVLKGDTEPVDMQNAAKQTWDYMAMYIPEGFDFYGGTNEDPSDIRYFAIQKSSDKYFAFDVEDEKSIVMDQYKEYKKKYTNEQEDVDETYGANDWVGFQFVDEETGHVKFVAHTKKYGTYILLRAEGFDFYSEATKSVIGAVEVEKRNDSTLPGGDSYDVD